MSLCSILLVWFKSVKNKVENLFAQETGPDFFQIFKIWQIEQSNEIAAAAQIEFTFAAFDKFNKAEQAKPDIEIFIENNLI